jgi:hypothetical protein
MDKIVDLKSYRAKVLEQKAYSHWGKRFRETFSLNTRLSDLSNKTIFLLATPGENSSQAFYELIMGMLDLGEAAKFYYLANQEQMRVVDIHLFLADQVRFEMMRRLGWLETIPSGEYRIVDLVLNFDAIRTSCRGVPPAFVKTHSEYSLFAPLTPGDKEVFIRRKLQEALDAFKKRLD